MSALEIGEILIAASLLIAVTALAVLVLRRRRVAAGCPLSLAAVRPSSGRWRLGLLRLGPDSLQWFPVVALTTRPSYEWDRARLEVSTPTGEPVDLPGLSGAVEISLSVDDGANAPLAVERGVYMAIRSWLESAPPGRDVNVA